MARSLTQYIGFPVVTPTHLIKYGFYFEGREINWVAVAKDRFTGSSVGIPAKCAADARRIVEDLRQKSTLLDN